MYKVVVFDMDGTLVNTLDSISVPTNKMLADFGYGPRDINEFKYFAGDGADTLVQRALDAAGADVPLKDALEAYMKYFATYCNYRVRPYDGLMDLLAGLKEKGVKTAVLTNKPHAEAVKVAAELFGDDTFTMVLGQQAGIQKKPSPEGALKIAEELGVDPSECLYVGDTNVDMKTGCSAGMYAVGVLWGFREEQELVDNGAKSIISHPMELLELL